jgi:hypothetical protein
VYPFSCREHYQALHLISYKLIFLLEKQVQTLINQKAIEAPGAKKTMVEALVMYWKPIIRKQQFEKKI